MSKFSLFFTTCSSHQQVFDSVRDRNASVPVLTGATGEFSSPESYVCADSSFGIHSTPVPGQSAKSAGGNSIQLKNFNHPTRGNFVVVMAGS